MNNTLPIISMEDRSKDGQLYLFIAVKGCNIHCKHCFVYNRIIGPAKETEIIEIQEFVQSDLYDGIIVSGGEPLLYPNGLETLLSGISKKAVVYTNGLNITALNRLASLVDQFLISIKHPDDLMEFDNYSHRLDRIVEFEEDYPEKTSLCIVDTDYVTEDYIEFIDSMFISELTVREEE